MFDKYSMLVLHKTNVKIEKYSRYGERLKLQLVCGETFWQRHCFPQEVVLFGEKKPNVIKEKNKLHQIPIGIN